MSRLISSKVKKVPSSQVSEDRYNFLQLSEAEPDLGVPAGNGYLLISQTDGTRSWIESESIRGTGSGFRYVFDGFGNEVPEDGTIMFYFPGEGSNLVLISKITSDFQNISEVISTLDNSTNYDKSYVILKSLEPGSTKFFYFYVRGITESFDHYSLYISSAGGEAFGEGEKISFEFSQIGDQGAAVSILGRYATLEDLQLNQPVGVVGSSYIVEDSGFLYVWDNISNSWISVGNITGPQGPPGPPPPQIDGGTALTVF